MLDNIKRKAPAPRKAAAQQNEEAGVPSNEDITGRIASLVAGQEEMGRRIQVLSNTYNLVMNELQTLNRKVDEHSRLLSSMVYPNRRNFDDSGLDPALRQPHLHSQMIDTGNPGNMHGDEGFPVSHTSSSNNHLNNAITPIEQAQTRLLKSSPQDNNAPKNSRQMQLAPGQTASGVHQAHIPHDQMSPLTPSLSNNPNFAFNAASVPYSVDNTSPHINSNSIMDFNANEAQFGIGGNGMDVAAKTRSRPLAARKKSAAFNPIWTREPNILLVEDDEICSRIGQKFLGIAKCASNTAVCTSTTTYVEQN